MQEKYEGSTPPQESKKFGENKRVKSIKEEIDKLQKELNVTLQELETREADPNFKKALQLFDGGYRLNGWDSILKLPNKNTILRKNGEEIGYWSSSHNKDEDKEEVYSLLNMKKSDENFKVIRYLDDLTKEE